MNHGWSQTKSRGRHPRTRQLVMLQPSEEIRTELRFGALNCGLGEKGKPSDFIWLNCYVNCGEMMNRIRTVMLFGGVMLSSVGCMTPMYRMPTGYSGSYARHLSRAVGTSTSPVGGVSEEVSDAAVTEPSGIRRRIKTRGPEQGRSSSSRIADAPVSGHPPQPSR